VIKKYSVDHIGLWTDNALRLINFYKKKLGFKTMSSQRLASDIVKKIFGFNTTCCFYRLKSDGLLLEIFEPHKKFIMDKPKFIKGIHHFGLVVENRENFIEKASKQMIKIVKVRRDGHFVYFIKDPDENMIEIRQKD
jgi:catechol 2,3-dioxygenase-like lactoylglutathione lyase family enzyme